MLNTNTPTVSPLSCYWTPGQMPSGLGDLLLLIWSIHFVTCSTDTAIWDRSSDAFLPKERSQCESLPRLRCVKHRCRKRTYLVLPFWNCIKVSVLFNWVCSVQSIKPSCFPSYRKEVLETAGSVSNFSSRGMKFLFPCS